LVKGKYERFPKSEKKKKDDDEDENTIRDVSAEDLESDGFDYLLSMKIWSLTKERVDSLKVLIPS
jgi:DNA topoisomerase-2